MFLGDDMEIKFAIFDLDGTLVDTLFLWDDIWSEIGKRYKNDPAFRPTAEEDLSFRTQSLSETMEFIHNRYHMGKSGKELLDFTNSLIFDFYANSVQLKPGVREFLDHCYHSGTKMCVASASAQELIDLALTHCGVKDYFVETMSCDAVGKGKDHPDIYLKAQEILRASAEEIWIFEDSITALQTAQKLGMPRVGIYDRCNDDQETVKACSTVYVGEGETMEKLLI